jgi:hypothetical protein
VFGRVRVDKVSCNDVEEMRSIVGSMRRPSCFAASRDSIVRSIHAPHKEKLPHGYIAPAALGGVRERVRACTLSRSDKLPFKRTHLESWRLHFQAEGSDCLRRLSPDSS